jgi:hypothetical protein
MYGWNLALASIHLFLFLPDIKATHLTFWGNDHAAMESNPDSSGHVGHRISAYFGVE